MILFKEKNYLEQFKGFHFFYGSYLSNWAFTPFIDTSTCIPYNCSEQYMMQKKAILFNDFETAKAIMMQKNPRDQKALGRTVKDFNIDTWNLHARQIVYEGCFYKFTQDKKAYEYLMSTKNLYLVEASPTDVVWGIGIAVDDKENKDPKNWKGTNWLGHVLTTLREDLIENPHFVPFT
jgi:ribA/ribD-fused uncharacterized protein